MTHLHRTLTMDKFIAIAPFPHRVLGHVLHDPRAPKALQKDRFFKNGPRARPTHGRKRDSAGITSQ